MLFDFHSLQEQIAGGQFLSVLPLGLEETGEDRGGWAVKEVFAVVAAVVVAGIVI